MGTIIVFGVGISLGNVLLKTGAAQWLSDQTFGVLGLKHLPIIATIALITLFNILIHLGFAECNKFIISVNTCFYFANLYVTLRRPVYRICFNSTICY